LGGDKSTTKRQKSVEREKGGRGIRAILMPLLYDDGKTLQREAII